MTTALVAVFDNDDAIEEVRDHISGLQDARRKLCVDLEHSQVVAASAMRRTEELKQDLEELNAEIRVHETDLGELRARGLN